MCAILFFFLSFSINLDRSRRNFTGSGGKSMHSLRFRKIYRTSSVTGFELAWKTASTRSVTDEKGTKKT